MNGPRPYTPVRRALWVLRRFLFAPPLRAEPSGVLERFQEKCSAVFRRKRDKTRNLERVPDSKNRERALEPLVVAGLFRAASGIGESARACAAGLKRHGVEPVCVDLSAEFGQADFEPEIELAPMPRASAGTLILHVNAPETERALFHLDLWRPKKWRIIGYWAWELAEAPESWLPAAKRLSELWTPSAFTAGAFRGRVAIPVKVVPHRVEAPASPGGARAALGIGAGEVVCLAMGDGRSSIERKNLTGAVAAFRAAAGDRADRKLIVKTRAIAEFPEAERALREAAEGDKRVRFIDGAYGPAERDRLLAAADIFLSLHRSEGFGLVLAEAMARGLAVVATGWSGNLEFMDAASAALIPSAPVPARDPLYADAPRDAQWAEPDPAAAAAALRRLMDDPDRRRALGEAARRAVAAKLDGRAYVEALGWRGAPPGGEKGWPSSSKRARDGG